MDDKKKPDDRRGKRTEQPDGDQDDYSPGALSDTPRKYRFEDWASI